jgi:hypothetical protein
MTLSLSVLAQPYALTSLRSNQPFVPEQNTKPRGALLEEKFLDPSDDAEVQVHNIKAKIYADNSVTISGSTVINLDQPLVTYHLVVNLEESTYTTVPYTDTEIQELKSRQASDEIRESASRSGNFYEEQQFNPARRSSSNLTTNVSPYYRFNF